jgi:hypothetical protein
VRVDDEELHIIPASLKAPPWPCCPVRWLAAYYARPVFMERAAPQIRIDRDVSRCRTY